MNQPPLLQALAFDPILGRVKLIAEAWDAGGLYQVGTFPSWQRWSEWNGRYRDDIRRFLKGDSNMAGIAANRILGSTDLYNPIFRGETASVNFITCHDGFTMWDLFSYNQKHNEANGWNNTDGSNDNNSWNCGEEGVTTNLEVLTLRKRLIRNACAILMISRGTPMILAGDEFGNTQCGNNNAYCQDNEISWLDWSMIEKNQDIYEFYKYMIKFRKEHAVLKKNMGNTRLLLPQTSIHGLTPWYLDEVRDHHYLGVLYAGLTKKGEGDYIYVAINTYWEEQTAELPYLSCEYVWTVCVDTKAGLFDGCEEVGSYIIVGERSIQILVGRRMDQRRNYFDPKNNEKVY